ncbi:MAG: TolC family protein [Bacteroidota bacterium]
MRRFLGVLTIMFLAGAVCFSQGPTEKTTKSITLDGAVQIALERNISVLTAQYTLEGQQSAVTAAYGGLLPTLSATGYWQRTQSDRQSTFIQGVGNIPLRQVATTNSFNTSIGSNLLLFNGFANTASVRRATSNAVSAEQTLNRTRQSIVFDVQTLYSNLLRDEELLKVNEDNLKRDRRQLEQIVESNRVGSKSIADVYRQQVQVGNDELALIQAQSTYDKARADLIFALGLSVADAYDFHDPSIKPDIDTTEFKAVNEQYRDFRSLVTEALGVRPDYLSAIENVNAANSSVTVAIGGHFPSISAFVSYGLNSAEINSLSDNRSLIWGLSVSFPLFNGWQTTNQVQQAKVTLKTAEQELSQAERQVQVDIAKSLLDLEAAEKQVYVTMNSVISATEDRRIAEEKYSLGAGTILDLLTAEANYSLALSNKVNAAYNYFLTKKQLEYNIGRIRY